MTLNVGTNPPTTSGSTTQHTNARTNQQTNTQPAKHRKAAEDGGSCCHLTDPVHHRAGGPITDSRPRSGRLRARAPFPAKLDAPPTVLPRTARGGLERCGRDARPCSGPALGQIGHGRDVERELEASRIGQPSRGPALSASARVPTQKEWRLGAGLHSPSAFTTSSRFLWFLHEPTRLAVGFGPETTLHANAA